MTTDQKIQLAMLIVASAPLAVFVLKRYVYDRRLGVRMKAQLEARHGAYVSAVLLRRDEPDTVVRVAVWCRVQIYNRSASRVVVVGLTAGKRDNDDQRKVEEPIFRTMTGHAGDIATSEPLRLPIAIDAHDVVAFWCLIEIPIPHQLGTSIFKFYGEPSKATSGYRKTKALFVPGAEEELIRRKIPKDFPAIIEARILEVVLQGPLLSTESDGYKIYPRLGVLPRYGEGELWSEALATDQVAMLQSSGKTTEFVICASLADDRVVEYVIKTNSPLWFTEKEHEGSF